MPSGIVGGRERQARQIKEPDDERAYSIASRRRAGRRIYAPTSSHTISYSKYTTFVGMRGTGHGRLVEHPVLDVHGRGLLSLMRTMQEIIC